MFRFISEAYPICRSITGDGVRKTLRVIGERIPLTVHEVPSGTRVLDWTVPDEWNIRDAYVADTAGRRLVDFRASNLHVVGYSQPVRFTLELSELRRHCHTLPDRPEWIPYRTSFYEPTWGFCLSQRQLEALPDAAYEVCIDSSLEPGHLTYGECLLPGAVSDEVLISAHCCHPSLCNDNLSGMALALGLAQRLCSMPRKYSYRFVFVPGTIGAITWLARNESAVSRVRHGLVLTCVGDAGPLTYKKSRRGNAAIDRAAAHVLRHSGKPHDVLDFFPYGADERQYCSPGFDLAVGCFMRTPYGAYPEYHTSADNLELVRPECLEDSLETCLRIIRVLEGDGTYVNQKPNGEPQLGRRGLYQAGSTGLRPQELQLALMWVLNLSDGSSTLLDIAERSNLRFDLLRVAADRLLETDLLLPVKQQQQAGEPSTGVDRWLFQK